MATVSTSDSDFNLVRIARQLQNYVMRVLAVDVVLENCSSVFRILLEVIALL